MANASLAQAATDLTIETPQGTRHALVFRQGEGPQPTLLVLHGALATAALTARSTGFREAAARRGFTAVFPDGVDRQWNDGREGGHRGPDDVAFIRALVKHLVDDGIALPRRLYIAGISNGGMMSFTMACKAPELFAGVGTVIANMPAGIEPCTSKPMTLVMVNGTADPMVPFEGGGVGLGGGRGTVLSVDATLARFTAADGCAAPAVREDVLAKTTADRLRVTRDTWSGCSIGTSVTLYRVEGGGHAMFGRRALLGGLLGPSTQDFVAADAVVDALAGT